MLYVYSKENQFEYEIRELIKVFFKNEKIEWIQDEALVGDQSFLLKSEVVQNEDDYTIVVKLLKGAKEVCIKQEGYTLQHDVKKDKKEIKRKLKLCIYYVLKETFHVEPPWGILTGIRPTKLVHECLDEHKESKEIEKILTQKYAMSKEKVHLIQKIAEIERPILSLNDDEYVSVYVGIPFCPTRCVYCSFPSNPLDRGNHLLESYVDALCYEIKEVGKILNQHHKKLQTLYIGGGTPTTLSHIQLEKVILQIKKYMNTDDLKEITVEAGRPDTITKEKLWVLKEQGVDRISINPQSMNQETLNIIGRSHTKEDIIKAYELAKSIGFKTINMDLIIGLPSEDEEKVKYTMKEIEKLSPENITVHTLAIKKSSRLKESLNAYTLADETEAKKMLEVTKDYTDKMGLHPYYMYRQKYMLGNLENIGYAKPNHECIYNIQIMEERQSIIALGAGAASKICYPHENRLERVANVTNVEQYIERIDEMVERKRKEIEKPKGKMVDR